VEGGLRGGRGRRFMFNGRWVHSSLFRRMVIQRSILIDVDRSRSDEAFTTAVLKDYV
jgi:hypothetical protein